MICLGVVFFMFPMLGVHQSSQICGFIIFIKFGNFLDIISPITCTLKLIKVVLH